MAKESRSRDTLRLLLRFSDWHRLKRVVAWLLRARPSTRQHTELFATKQLYCKSRPISLDEIEKAEILVLKLIQREAFFKGIEIIRERKKNARAK